MSAVRRTALLSIFAAAALVALKLAAGLASGSLGLLAEAAHSSTDLVAALLTFFAVRVGERPADDSHPYGHGKAEHLSALAESAVLLIASAAIIIEAIGRLTSSSHPGPETRWWTFAILSVVIAIDISRTVASHRVAREHHSAAIRANAMHFASDLGGSLAVLIGLVLAANGHPGADSVAAIAVAVLVIVAAARLMRENINVLMDSAPEGVETAARKAIEGLGPGVDLRRLRLRSAGGKTFADVVVGVPPDTGVATGHALADDVEAVVSAAIGDCDVVVHVEPNDDGASARARASAAALTVPDVREVHNVELVRLGDRLELSLHLKMPRNTGIGEAHAAADLAERAIARAVPELDAVHTHIEPLAELFEGEAIDPDDVPGTIIALRDAALEVTGSEPTALVLRRTGRGLVALITVSVEPDTSLSDAHSLATRVESLACQIDPTLDEVVVHTEPRD